MRGFTSFMWLPLIINDYPTISKRGRVLFKDFTWLLKGGREIGEFCNHISISPYVCIVARNNINHKQQTNKQKCFQCKPSTQTVDLPSIRQTLLRMQAIRRLNSLKSIPNIVYYALYMQNHLYAQWRITVFPCCYSAHFHSTILGLYLHLHNYLKTQNIKYCIMYAKSVYMSCVIGIFCTIMLCHYV